MKPYYPVLFVFVVAVVGSCGAGKHSFEHRKYLNLKDIRTSVSATILNSHDVSDSIICDTLITKDSKVMLVTIVSENEEAIRFSDCPPGEMEYEISRAKIQRIIYSKKPVESGYGPYVSKQESKKQRASNLVQLKPGTPERIRSDYRTYFRALLGTAAFFWILSAVVFMVGLVILGAGGGLISLLFTFIALIAAILGMLFGIISAQFSQKKAEKLISGLKD